MDETQSQYPISSILSSSSSKLELTSTLKFKIDTCEWLNLTLISGGFIANVVNLTNKMVDSLLLVGAD